MPNQKTLMIIGITALIVLIFNAKIRSLPVISKLPTA